MPYQYLEDSATADIAFEANGSTLSELFAAAADAVTNVMIEDLRSIAFQEGRVYEDRSEAIDFLLFDFLQELIYYKDSEQLILRAASVNIGESEQQYRLFAVFKGEPLNLDKHEQRVDVKAVTLHQFNVEKKKDTWHAHVILDI